MKNLIILSLSLLLLSFSCMDSEDVLRSDLSVLEELEQEIVILSESVPCTNSSEWKFTAMGSKACGGPTRYIAYHQSVEEKFLGLVSKYTKLQGEYNLKHDVVSDCSLIVAPRTIICEAGKPVFIN